MSNDTQPEIRFPGFTEDWEQRKLGELADEFKSGYSIKAENIFDKGEYPVYGGNGIRGFTDTFNHDGEFALIGRQGALSGNMNFSTNKAYFTEHAIAVRANNMNDTRFLYFLLCKLQLGRWVTQSAQPGLAVGTLVEIRTQVPGKAKEQQKLGTFFKKLDDTITLHQRKLDLLKKTKKGFLQKMFPKNGAKVPEIRFPGFTEAWEERKLETLFEKGGSGGTPKSTNPDYYRGDIPFLGISDISNSNGYIKKTEKSITLEGLNNSAAWVVPKGAISLAMYASVGKLAILNIDVATSQAFYNMVFNDDRLRDFVYQRLSMANDLGEWIKLISTGTQANLNADKVKNFVIQLPSNIEEIGKIGSFLNQIDNTITLHQRELDLLKETKKGFLQKMFV